MAEGKEVLIVSETALAAAKATLPSSSDVLAAAKALVIRGEPSYKAAVALKNDTKALIKTIHTALDPLCQLAHKMRELANKTRKEQLETPEEALTLVEDKISRYANEQIQKENEAKRKQAEALAAAEKAGDTVAATQILTAAAPVNKAKVAGVTFREHWELVVDNPDLVPDPYWMLDLKTLGEMARTMKDKFSVAGCRAVRKDIVI